MGALVNQRHERFAQSLAKGMTADAAYVAAGFKANPGNCIRLKGNESVQERVTELLSAGAKRAEITAEMVIRELARIGFSDIRRAVKWSSNIAVASPDERSLDEIMEDGPGEIRHAISNQVELIDSDEIDDDTAAAIAEVSQSSTGALKIKFHDKRAALVDIGRHLGIFSADNPGININIALGLQAFYGDRRDA